MPSSMNLGGENATASCSMGWLLALIFLVVGCEPPSQRDPSIYGAVTVALGRGLDGVTDWREDQRARLGESLPQLAALGPTVTLTTEGRADVVVRTFDSGPGCAAGVGRYHPGSAYVEVDPACADGYAALARAVNHEIVHWLTWSRYAWVGHLCAYGDTHADCHPDLRFTPGRDPTPLLAPGLSRTDPGPGTDEAYVPEPADPSPTSLDLELVRRCQERGRCL